MQHLRDQDPPYPNKHQDNNHNIHVSIYPNRRQDPSPRPNAPPPAPPAPNPQGPPPRRWPRAAPILTPAAPEPRTTKAQPPSRTNPQSALQIGQGTTASGPAIEMPGLNNDDDDDNDNDDNDNDDNDDADKSSAPAPSPTTLTTTNPTTTIASTIDPNTTTTASASASASTTIITTTTTPPPPPPSVTPPKPIRCKACGRALCSVSAAGALEPAPLSHPCATCQPFGELHAAVRSADEQWELLKGRRQTYSGRGAALNEHKAARMALTNFLLSVERVGGEGDGDRQGGGGGELRRGMKRSWDDGEEAEEAEEEEADGGVEETEEPRRRRRRLRFDTSVAFRDEDEYRAPEAFQRTDEVNYVRGRNAPVEGGDGFLDTSGNSVAYSVFTLQRKTKKGWVSTPTAEEADRLFKAGLEGGVPEGGGGASGDGELPGAHRNLPRNGQEERVVELRTGGPGRAVENNPESESRERDAKDEERPLSELHTVSEKDMAGGDGAAREDGDAAESE